MDISMQDITLAHDQARALTDRIKAGFEETRRLKAMLPAAPKPGLAAETRSVYFIRADNGLIKIGVAAAPRERLRTIRTMSPIPLRLVLVLPGLGAAGEAELHQRFAAHRSHGEWFFPCTEIDEFIRESL
ncbi:GIY-YIG nuclease family protein [Streptomyces zaomyceticus]|uniref:GIY-YIG nuclease family protein n=1 Tax=Streptomyces zaomyceticus TaxID=68286 RepID=UPI0036997C12